MRHFESVKPHFYTCRNVVLHFQNVSFFGKVILSRFDLIFSIIDKPNREKDMELAIHILYSHKAGEVIENIAKSKKTKYTREEQEDLVKNIMPVLSPEFLRKYVAYAKRNIFPTRSDQTLTQRRIKQKQHRSFCHQHARYKPSAKSATRSNCCVWHFLQCRLGRQILVCDTRQSQL